MSKVSTHNQRPLQELPNISYRHLEVLQMVHREGSYTNAAHELHTTRANIKRICSNLEKELNNALFEEDDEKALHTTSFGLEILSNASPLTRSLLHLGEGIRTIQRKGLILRFAACNEFFRGGAFSYILSRIEVTDLYRPCYLRIEMDRFKAALLSSECDVYFAAGLATSKRLEIIPLDRIPWSFHPGPEYAAEQPKKPADLIDGKWLIQPTGDEEAAKDLIREIQKAGAKKGRILKPDTQPKDDEIILKPESSWMGLVNPQEGWPSFMFSAAVKKQHPYGELISRLNKASRI